MLDNVPHVTVKEVDGKRIQIQVYSPQSIEHLLHLVTRKKRVWRRRKQAWRRRRKGWWRRRKTYNFSPYYKLNFNFYWGLSPKKNKWVKDNLVYLETLVLNVVVVDTNSKEAKVVLLQRILSEHLPQISPLKLDKTKRRLNTGMDMSNILVVCLLLLCKCWQTMGGIITKLLRPAPLPSSRGSNGMSEVDVMVRGKKSEVLIGLLIVCVCHNLSTFKVIIEVPSTKLDPVSIIHFGWIPTPKLLYLSTSITKQLVPLSRSTQFVWPGGFSATGRLLTGEMEVRGVHSKIDVREVPFGWEERGVFLPGLKSFIYNLLLSPTKKDSPEKLAVVVETLGRKMKGKGYLLQHLVIAKPSERLVQE